MGRTAYSFRLDPRGRWREDGPSEVGMSRGRARSPPELGETPMHRFSAFVTAAFACVLFAAVPAVAGNVSVGSPPGTTPQNHQNEPAVAVDANHPNFLVAGWNDFVDWAPCPQADATTFGTCEDPADSGVGPSAGAFSVGPRPSLFPPELPGGAAAG